AHKSCSGDGVVHHLALERVHGLESDGLARLLHVSDHGFGFPDQLGLARGAVARDVKHEPRTLARLGLHRKTSELLKSVEHLTLAPYEAREPTSALVREDLHGGAAVLDVDLDVAIDIGDVEKLLKVVGSDLAFFVEPVVRPSR